MEQITHRAGSVGVGVFISVILIWAIKDFGNVEIPDEVGQAITGLITFITQDLIRRFG